jgi:hypothetical protein
LGRRPRREIKEKYNGDSEREKRVQEKGDLGEKKWCLEMWQQEGRERERGENDEIKVGMKKDWFCEEERRKGMSIFYWANFELSIATDSSSVAMDGRYKR